MIDSDKMEVMHDHTDNDNYTHIDVYYGFDDEIGGKTVALVCNDTKKVVFIHNEYRLSDLVKEAIDEVLEYIEK